MRTFMISRSILLRIKTVSNEVLEKIKTHFMFNTFFPKIVPLMRYCLKIW